MILWGGFHSFLACFRSSSFVSFLLCFILQFLLRCSLSGLGVAKINERVIEKHVCETTARKLRNSNWLNYTSPLFLFSVELELVSVRDADEDDDCSHLIFIKRSNIQQVPKLPEI